MLPVEEVVDPVFGEPTKYGTPYHALCHAQDHFRMVGDKREHAR
jgi:hypothetical protein